MVGQSVTFTATVTGNTMTFDNSGTVQFAVDGTPYGSPVSLSGGNSATIADATLSGGTHTITATYNGDTTFNTSSGTLSGGQSVSKIGATTALTSASPTTSIANQSVSFTATVTPTPSSTLTPTGTVTFEDNGSAIGTASISGGTATFASTTLPVGTNTITAVYGGDTNFTGSTATVPISEVVLSGTLTWTGATSGNFSTATNWVPDAVPVSGENLIFPTTTVSLTLNDDIPGLTVGTITITGTGYTLGSSAGNTLGVTGTLSNAGTTTISPSSAAAAALSRPAAP